MISLGSSGTGKSHLQEKVGELIPPEDKIEITTLSQNAFYYFGRQELKNKLILIEDLDGAGEVLYPLRELQSKQAIAKSLPDHARLMIPGAPAQQPHHAIQTYYITPLK